MRFRSSTTAGALPFWAVPSVRRIPAWVRLTSDEVVGERQVGGLVRLRDDHQAAGDRGGLRVLVSQVRQVGSHGRVRSRQRRYVPLVTKTEEIAPAGGIGANGGV
jgi:hypothetical protein